VTLNQSYGDGWFYLLAALCGVGAGIADVVVDDKLFTALLVLASCMMIGLMRPKWPWRWALVVGAMIPVTDLAAHEIWTVYPTHAQTYGAFLAFLPGIAGAYGGAVMRGAMDNLKQKK
jgi:TctA family transporter